MNGIVKRLPTDSMRLPNETPMLQNFLDAELLSDIGDEGEKFSALEQAAPVIAKSLTEDLGKLVPFTLVALDPEAAESELAFIEAEVAVKENWKTLRNKHKEMPRQLLRAVIWEALEQVGNADEDLAAVIWLTATSYLPYSKLGGRALPLCQKLVQRMGEKLEKKATSEWATNTEVKSAKFPVWNLELGSVKIDPDEFTQLFAAAAGPSDEQGTALQNANRFWPATNQHTQWAHQFAPRAARAVAAVANKAAESIFAALQPLEGNLQKHGAAVNAAVHAATNAAVASVIAQQRRSDLLWWKQTLFSESRRRSYRGLTGASAAILMAHDLTQSLPAFVPQSVEFLLRETLRDAVPPSNSLTTFEELLADLKKDAQGLALGELLEGGEVSDGRLCLATFVEEMLAGRLQPEDLGKRVGLNLKDKIAAEELSVWVFRDLQARRLIEGE